jgi:hypothetical protein
VESQGKLVTLGVAIDWDPVLGFEYLQRIYPWHQISTGRNWLNATVLNFIWNDPRVLPVTPQVLVIRHHLETRIVSGKKRIVITSQELLHAASGSDAIAQLASNPNPLTATSPIERIDL